MRDSLHTDNEFTQPSIHTEFCNKLLIFTDGNVKERFVPSLFGWIFTHFMVSLLQWEINDAGLKFRMTESRKTRSPRKHGLHPPGIDA